MDNLTVTVLKRGLCVYQQPRCFLEGIVKRSKENSPNQALGSCVCPSCCSYRQLLLAHPEESLARALGRETWTHACLSLQ